VGVGQMELDVMENVDTVVVALVPGAGDDIQAMKAGLMEIADIFAVNKADRPGADSLVVEIRNMLDLVGQDSGWRIPVLATQAENNVGVGELYERIWHHRKTCIDTGVFAERRAEQRRNEFTAVLQKMVVQEFMNAISSDRRLSRYVSRMNEGKMSPYEAAEKIYSAISETESRNQESTQP